MFSSNCSSGHNQRKFGHTANFFAKSPKKFSSKFRKVGKNCFFEKIFFFFQGDPLGPIECGFEKPFWIVFSKILKLTKLVIEHQEKFPQNVPCSFGCVICSLENAVKKTLAKSEGFFAQCLKRTKKIFLLKALFSSKNHYCVSRMQNWQACQDYKTFFTKRPSGMIECSFIKHPISFPKSVKVTKQLIEFQRKVPKIVPLDSQYAVMRTQIEIMAIVRTLFARSLKNKKEVFYRHYSPQNVPPATANGILATLLTF